MLKRSTIFGQRKTPVDAGIYRGSTDRDVIRALWLSYSILPLRGRHTSNFSITPIRRSTS